MIGNTTFPLDRSTPAEPQIPMKVYLMGAAIAGAVIFLYFPALQFGFVYLDDHTHVVKNEHLRSFDTGFIQWAFTTFKTGNWYPLTWISLAFDYSLWGPDPFGYHLHNILLHALNSLLVMMLLYRMLTAYGRSHYIPSHSFSEHSIFAVSALTAVLFGLHPLRVESVAWVFERKDVLCAFFYLVSISLYLSYASAEERRRRTVLYVSSFLAFCCALLAKSMAVSLPFVLVLVDIFCLKRRPGSVIFPSKGALRDKVPFLLLSCAIAVVTLFAQRSTGAVRSLTDVSLVDRLLNSLHSFWFYVLKTVVPSGLSPFYPLPGVLSLSSLSMLIAVVFFLAVLSSCIYAYAKRVAHYWPGLWSYYFITLLPVIGLVQIGSQRAADRYTYLPSIGLLVLLSLGLVRGVERVGERIINVRPHSALLALPILFALALAPLTREQLFIWQDSLALTQRAVAVSPQGSAIPYFERGLAWLDRSEYERALQDCGHAIALQPRFPRAFMCRAEAHEKLGDYRSAIDDYSTLLRYFPTYSDALHNRGLLYQKVGEPARAKADFTLRDYLEAN